MRFELKATCDRRRLTRLVKLVVGAFLAVAAVRVIPLWVVTAYQTWVPSSITWQMAVVFLWAVWIAYCVLVVGVPIAIAVLAVQVRRARRGGVKRPGASKMLLLCGASLLGLALMEGAAAAWLAWVHRLPELPTRFKAAPENEIHLVVIGESSARGVPYHPWLSVGKIVAWQLERALPGRRVHLQELTGDGICLEQAILLLFDVEHHPDAIIVYGGHNEFQARFAWQRNARYYADEQIGRRSWLKDRVVRLSWFCRFLEETIDRYRVGDPPPPHVTRQLVDHPAYTADEYAFLRGDFHRRLEGVVAYCQQIGALPILIIPPGNEGGAAPFRSYVGAQSSKLERDRFTGAFLAARSLEQTDSAQAMAACRALLAREPTFAEAHFRLARLLEAAGDWEQANRHYVLARDYDGFPMRCPSDFQEAYRSSAARHDGLLVDGPAVLRRKSPHGIVDDHLIHDAQHPSLRGYVALAQEIVDQLHARHALGWPDAAPAPVIDPAECAAHFGIDAAKWASVCERSSLFYGRTAFMRYDPLESLQRAHRLKQASRQIAESLAPESAGIPSVGVHIAEDAQTSSGGH